MKNFLIKIEMVFLFIIFLPVIALILTGEVLGNVCSSVDFGSLK